MNILDKITKLREERHWSEYQLAEKSGLTQSTISTWYRKNMIPSIASLSKICEAFDITLSQFFMEESDNATILTKKQLDLLTLSTRLTSEQYDALLLFLKSF